MSVYGDTPPQRGKELLTFSQLIEKNNLFHVFSLEVADDSSFRPQICPSYRREVTTSKVLY